MTLGHVNKNMHVEAQTPTYSENGAAYNLMSIRNFAAHPSITSIVTHNHKSARTTATHSLL